MLTTKPPGRLNFDSPYLVLLNAVSCAIRDFPDFSFITIYDLSECLVLISGPVRQFVDLVSDAVV